MSDKNLIEYVKHLHETGNLLLHEPVAAQCIHNGWITVTVDAKSWDTIYDLTDKGKTVLGIQLESKMMYTVKKQTWATGYGYYIEDASGKSVSNMYADEGIATSLCAVLNTQTTNLRRELDAAIELYNSKHERLDEVKRELQVSRERIADLERQLDDAHNTLQEMD